MEAEGVAVLDTAPSPLRRAHSGGAQCCCGHPECEFLKKNASALADLENDVRQAATMGQALLVRHESYMADAEKERNHMNATIEKLEQEKRELEVANARTIRENRGLLDQLEDLNRALVESDAQVKSLTDALSSTQEELQRIAVLAERSETLERQLLQIERDQELLQENLSVKVNDERTAVQRWRHAERIITNLQDQIDQIEREASEERNRHIEIVGRMERRSQVERELQTAAGRLKGAAAAKTAGGQGSNVVSHFVKDILQDNAELQMGIVELREMLMNSNEEVQRLREQLILHRPIDESDQPSAMQNLRHELGTSPEKPRQDVELHVHHHYHAPEKPNRAPGVRKARKKRHIITPSHFTPPMGHTPRSSISKASPGLPSPLGTSSAATILSQTSVTVPQNKRWSIQSSQTGASIDTSSAPGSPYARSHRTSSIFDRVFSDAPYDSSRPTSPESMASPPFTPLKELSDIGGSCPDDSILGSSKAPKWLKEPRGRSSNASRSFSSPLALLGKSIPTTATASMSVLNAGLDLEPTTDNLHPPIPEEPEAESGLNIINTSVRTPTAIEQQPIDTNPAFEADLFRPKIRRSGSHESLISISGMDIHATPRQCRSYAASLTPLSTSFNTTDPVLSNMTATATASRPPTLRRAGPGADSSSVLSLSLLHHAATTPRTRSSSRTPSHRSADDTSSSAAGSDDPASASAASAGDQSLSQRIGGWVFGKWGFTPSPSSPVAVSAAGASPTSAALASSPLKSPQQFVFRSPGINQPGPIFGFGPEERSRVPFNVRAVALDEEALGEALGER